MRRSGAHRRARRVNYRHGAALVGVGAILSIVFFVPGAQTPARADAVAGQQGTDTSLPLTSSAVTVDGRGAFTDLKVTVNQTQNLENQDVSVTWTGSSPTDQTSDFEDNYLQIFQCWGNPDPTDPLDPVNPGPPPTQCEFGGWSINSSNYPTGSFSTYAYTRMMAQPNWSTYSADQSFDWTDQITNQAVDPYVDTTNGNQLVEPFVSVDGNVTNQQDDTNYDSDPTNPEPFWLNPYFSYNTTNEVDFARTYAAPGGGSEGQQNFEVDTGLEAPGLGCGQDIEDPSGGSAEVPQCWLVVVPRGTGPDENASNDTVPEVDTSPLTPEAWNNRIAIPLQFNPVGSSCAIGADEQRIVGSELAGSAVSSWQPALCATPGEPPFSYSTVSDDEARSNITNEAFGAAGMSVFSDPISATQTDPSNPVVYAPLTLSGVVVAFNIDRDPALVNGELTPSEVALEGTKVENLYLTPLLMAKLLTESYFSDFKGIGGDKSSAYAWVQNNPANLVSDPDFLLYNPEFSLLTTGEQQAASSVVIEESSSDAATAVWNWILSDPEAEAWLAGASTGEPAGDGTMKVNPLYSTNPAINPAGVAFGSSAPETYPQSDPYCINLNQALPAVPSIMANPQCIQNWNPFALNMNSAAQDVAEANSGSKTTIDPTALSADTAWGSDGPQVSGQNFVISITDSASAAQYGDQVASLSPSGDDAPDRPFVAPTEQSLLAGEQAMTPSPIPGVLQSDSSSTAGNAYPLTMLTYAATTPESLSQTARQNYASFLQYAVGAGQTPGENIGQLPAGYAPLPAALQAETLAAVKTILNPRTQSTTPATTPTTAPAPTPTSSNAPVSVTSETPPTVPTTVSSPGKTRETVKLLVPASISLNAGHQPYFGVGAVRWAFLLAVAVGLGATLGTVLVEINRRKRRRPRTGGVAAVGENS